MGDADGDDDDGFRKFPVSEHNLDGGVDPNLLLPVNYPVNENWDDEFFNWDWDFELRGFDFEENDLDQQPASVDHQNQVQNPNLDNEGHGNGNQDQEIPEDLPEAAKAYYIEFLNVLKGEPLEEVETEQLPAAQYVEADKALLIMAENVLLGEDEEQRLAAVYMVEKELQNGFVHFKKSEVLKFIPSLDQRFFIEDQSTKEQFVVKMEGSLDKDRYIIGGGVGWKLYIDTHSLKDGDRIEFSVPIEGSCSSTTMMAKRI